MSSLTGFPCTEPVGTLRKRGEAGGNLVREARGRKKDLLKKASVGDGTAGQVSSQTRDPMA